MTDKFILSMGCHKGTLMSRDSGSEECESLEQAREQVQQAEKFWKSIGYFVWFAQVKCPNGEVVKLHPGTSYT